MVEDYSTPLRLVDLVVDWGVALQEASVALEEEGQQEEDYLEIDPVEDFLETLAEEEVWGELEEEGGFLDRTHRLRRGEDCLLAVGWEGEQEEASFKHQLHRVSLGKSLHLLQ